MSLYKEPKRKRTKNEDDILRQYHESMNKPKRKYKQRKSKYDSEVWDSLDLNKTSTKEELPDGEFIEDDETKSNIKQGMERTGNTSKTTSSEFLDVNNSFDNFANLQSELHISVLKKINKPNEQGHGIIRRMGQLEGSGQIENTSLNNLERSESSAYKDDYCNTLLARKILGFLLNKNRVSEKRNMMHTLMLDSRLRDACLTEIRMRCHYLYNLHEAILSKLKKERTLLMDILNYLQSYPSTVSDENLTLNSNDAKDRGKDECSSNKSGPLSYPTLVGEKKVGKETLNGKLQTVTASQSSLTMPIHADNGSVELQSFGNEGATNSVERFLGMVGQRTNIISESLKGLLDLDNNTLRSPQKRTNNATYIDENRKQDDKLHSRESNVYVSEYFQALEGIGNYHMLSPLQSMNNGADMKSNEGIENYHMLSPLESMDNGADMKSNEGIGNYHMLSPLQSMNNGADMKSNEGIGNYHMLSPLQSMDDGADMKSNEGIRNYQLLSPLQSMNNGADLKLNESITHSWERNMKVIESNRQGYVASDSSLEGMDDFLLLSPIQSFDSQAHMVDDTVSNYVENTMSNAMPSTTTDTLVGNDNAQSTGNSKTDEMLRLAEIIASST